VKDSFVEKGVPVHFGQEDTGRGRSLLVDNARTLEGLGGNDA
jgi:hypothetical protein